MKNETQLDEYNSVSCDLVDRIEILATFKKSVKIIVDSPENIIEGTIKTWFTKNKQEFLEMESGEQIRLDKIISIEGQPIHNKICGE